MGVVFDLYMFVQRLYQAATGFWDEVVNTVAGEGGGEKKEQETCKQAEAPAFTLARLSSNKFTI